VLFRDITRLRQLEQVRQDFVANVSHELRSPLTVIRGFLENLLDGPLGRDAEVGPQLRLMEAQSQRMQSLVEDLLSLARMESTEPDPQRLQELLPAELLHRSLNSLAPRIQEKALRLALEVDEDLAILAEPLDVQSIVHNLVDNAVKYSAAGGLIRIAWSETATELCFTVEDQGDGIAPEHLRRITERFYRVDRGRSRRVGGTGLGLAIVRHAVERYRGRLEIHSEVGRGSVFRVHFPLALGRRREVEREPENTVAVIKVS
jgi:two-component system phosphate regulon sensor histidine kinase PhoR